MRNGAANSLRSEPEESGPWRFDHHPALRIAILFSGIAAALVTVATRLAYVQYYLPDSYVEQLVQTTTERESIPTYNGRIIASGQVLARDERLFTVTAHYRWLEDPPDPYWLKDYVRSRLTRAERKHPARVQAETEKVLELRQSLWERLSSLTETPLDVLRDKRSKIQDRVERMKRSSAERRARRQAEQDGPAPVAGATWWERAWQSVVIALTTSPRRETENPMVLRDELQYYLIQKDVTLRMGAAIEEHPEQYPGLRVVATSRRVYPANALASHVVGNRVQLTAERLEARRRDESRDDPLDYRLEDWVGETGLERYHDRHLRGMRGERLLVKNRHGEVLETKIVRQPRPGRDLEITLALPLQGHAERLLDDAIKAAPPPADQDDELPPAPVQGGAIVVMDVRNGELLVAANAPRPNLNVFGGGNPAEFAALQSDERKPFLNRFAQMAIPPGSVFKALTSVAILQKGTFDARHTIYCQGFLDNPNKHRCYHSHVHGDVDLTRALAQSCNVYFFTAARQMGAEPIWDWAHRFGFGQPTGVDLPAEAAGNLPLPREHMSGRRPGNSGVRPADPLGLAIGQASLTVTPLQIVRMMAAIANGGELPTPRLAASSVVQIDAGDSVDDHQAVAPLPPAELSSIPDLAPQTLAEIHEGLRQVVAVPGGTGFRTVRLKQIAIAGKTGSAQVTGKPDHAWFAGYVPADRPRYAFVIVLEHAGRSGGQAAGPLARQLVEEMLKEGLVGQKQLTQRDEPDE